MRSSAYTWIVPLALFLLLAPAALAGDPPAPAGATRNGVAFEPGTPPLADILGKAAAEKKPAFLDFFTDT